MTPSSDPHGNSSAHSTHIQVEAQANAYRYLSDQLLQTWRQKEPSKDVRETLEAILHQLDEVVIPEQEISATVYVYDEDVGFDTSAAIGPLKEYMQAKRPREYGTARHAMEKVTPLFVDDASSPPEDVPALDDEAYAQGVKAYANIPLTIGEDRDRTPVGILIINLTEHFKFEPKKKILSSFAGLAALTLQNARVHRRRLREKIALQEISRRTVAGNIEETANTIAKLTADLCNADYTTVWTSDATEEMLLLTGHFVVEGSGWKPPQKKLAKDDGSLSGLAISTGTIQYVVGLDDESAEHSEHWHSGCTAALAVPLSVRGTVVGAIYVATVRQTGISEEHRTFVEQLATHAAVALYNERLSSENKEQQRIREEALAFQDKTSDILPLPAQVRQIREQLQSFGLNTEGLFIASYDAANQQIRLPKVWDQGNFVEDSVKIAGTIYGPRKLNDKKGIVDWVVNNRTTLFVPDFLTWDHQDEIDIEYRQEIRSCLAVPMYALGGDIVGVLGLRGYKEPDMYSRHDRQFMELIAPHTATIIGNAEWRSQAEQSQELRLTITRFQKAIADVLTLREQVGQIRTELQKIGVATSGFFIATYDAQSERIELPIVYEEDKEIPEEEKVEGSLYGPRRKGDRKGLIEWMLDQTPPQTLLIESMNTWPWREEIEGDYRQNIGSIVAVPMIMKDEIRGFIGLRDDAEQTYGAFHRSLLEAVADYIPIVLENAEQLEVSTAISQFQRAISSPITLADELDAVYTAAREALDRLMDTENMYIALYDQTTDMLNFPLGYFRGERVRDKDKVPGNPAGEAWAPRLATGGRFGLTNWVLDNKTSLLIEENFEERCKALGIDVFDIETKSWLGAPLLRGSQVIGVIGLNHFRKVRGYTERHRALLETIASQASAAIDNAQQYSRREKELEAIASFQQKIGEVDPVKDELNQVYAAAGDCLAELMDTKEMYIALLDEEETTITFPLVHLHGEKVRDEVKVKDKLGEAWAPRSRFERNGLTERVISEGKALLIEADFENRCREMGITFFKKIKTKCWLGAPLKRGDRVIGVIGLQSFDREDVYSPRHKSLLETIASQTAVAIENARLAEKARKRRLDAIIKINKLLTTTSTNLDTLLGLIGEAANGMLLTDLASVYLYDWHTERFTKGVRVESGLESAAYSKDDLPDNTSVAAAVAMEQTAKYVSKGANQKHGFAQRYGFEAYGALPIFVRNPEGIPTTLGVFFINFHQPHEFTDTDKELLEILATQAAVAIDYIHTKEALVASEQLAALGPAMATLQHRLGNTINVSLPAVMRLRRRLEDDPTALGILDTIERNTNYATEVIRRMQTPLEPEAFTKTEVNSLLFSAIERCSKDAISRYTEITVISDITPESELVTDRPSPEIIEISSEFGLDMPETYARVGQLTEVFRVLIENAIKAVAPKSGRVTVKTHLDESRVRPHFEILVTDSGSGMDESKLSRIFKQPVPRQNFGEGAGLGLWLSNIIVRSHQGTIEVVKSTPGQGSTFRVSLPVLPSSILEA